MARSRFLRRFTALVALCALLLVAEGASRAQAQADVVESPAGDSDTLRDAVAAYEADDLPRALALFEAVHARAPTARTYRSLALVAFRQARFADAVRLLDQSLASAVKPLTEGLRADALALRDEAAGEAAAASLVKRAPPAAAAEPARAPTTALQAAPSSEAHAAMPRRSRRLKRAGYALLGAGAGAFLVSLTSTAIAVARIRDAEERCDARPAGGCSEQEAARFERDEHLDRLGRWVTASLVVGAASAAAGGVSLLLHVRAERERPQLAALGVAWTQRF